MDATSSAVLRLPVQAAVERTPSYGALVDGTGMEASQFNLGSLLQGIGQVASSPIGQAIGSALAGIL